MVDSSRWWSVHAHGLSCVLGLSLDHQTVSAVSRLRLSEREEESLSCFLRACDAALSYLQELDKVYLYIHAWSVYRFCVQGVCVCVYLCSVLNITQKTYKIEMYLCVCIKYSFQQRLSQYIFILVC